MKVAIWGSYNYGNYGDDVMAIMFALKLKELGCSPVIYRIHARLAEFYGIQSASTLDDLLQETLFVFIGGGSWLEKRSFGNSYEQDFCEFRLAIEKYECPCYALSIGGDLRSNLSGMEPQRLSLFKSKYFNKASVRLKIDLEVLENLEKSGEYHPDVVLSVSSYFKHQKSNKSKNLKVGLNLNYNHKRLAQLINKYISKLYPNTEFYYIQSHLPGFENNYEYVIKDQRANVKNFQYKDIDSFTKFISELDLLVSFKLHPGVTALSYGVPYYLLGGFEKTVAFFESIEAGGAVVSTTKLLTTLLFNTIRKAKEDFDFKLINHHKEKSIGHFIFLANLVKKYRL